jgi:hypothetical protein
MDEAGISDVLKSEPMGHEIPGMRGIYGHVSVGMRADFTAALRERWDTSLRERAQLSPRSSARILDTLLCALNVDGIQDRLPLRSQNRT